MIVFGGTIYAVAPSPGRISLQTIRKDFLSLEHVLPSGKWVFVVRPPVTKQDFKDEVD